MPGGRHRRPDSGDLPPDAPALVLAVPGDSLEVATEIASLTRDARADLRIHLGPLKGTVPGLAAVMNELAPEVAPGKPVAVVVPLLTGPHPATYQAIRSTQLTTGLPITVTDPLGPHPLLAEALHIRLAESGLARADRIRQFSIGGAIDAVIVLTAGNAAAVQDAEVTGVLLAARLAVPVFAASIDGIADAVAKLRESGATRLAIAPYFIGPEIDEGALKTLAAELEVGCAEPLGAHSGVARLVGLRYDVALDELAYDSEQRADEEAQ
jgi:sirohydrochlorin ferrochelatase